jgi:hypothetical protein
MYSSSCKGLEKWVKKYPLESLRNSSWRSPKKGKTQKKYILYACKLLRWRSFEVRTKGRHAWRYQLTFFRTFSWLFCIQKRWWKRNKSINTEKESRSGHEIFKQLRMEGRKVSNFGFLSYSQFFALNFFPSSLSFLLTRLTLKNLQTLYTTVNITITNWRAKPLFTIASELTYI